MRAAVVGLGKIGLPLAVQIAGRGIPTIGCDIDADVVDLVNHGRPPFPGEADLDERLAAVVESGTLSASTDTAAASEEVDVVVVVVPLIVDSDGVPDFRAMDAATADVAEGLHEGQLIVYETTLPVHTTRRRFAVALETASGLKAGVDFHVAHSPERVYSGRVFSDLRRYPKIVGGLTRACTERTVDFYRRALEFDDRPDLPRENGVWDMGTVEAAEFTKLAETTYRDVNIALANEFALFAENAGIDVHAVIEAANSQPFSHIHRPGLAVGGHCIPVYPRFYLSGDPAATLPAAARAANERMPIEAVDRVERELEGLEGRSVVILGATYRGGVKETAFSGVFPLAESMTGRGATVTVLDPLYTDSELERIGLQPHAVGSEVDAVILQADHAEFSELGIADFPGCRLVYDGRRVLDPAAWGDALVVTVGMP